MTKPPPTEPARVGDTDTLAAITARLEARGLDVVPASALPSKPAREDGHEAAARRAVRLKHYADRWAARVPAMYADASMDDLAGATAETAESARKITTWLAAEASTTLILAGSVGTGKTHAAYAIGNTAVKRGTWVEGWAVSDFLEAMRPGGDPSASTSARRCPLLILDDLGAGKATDFAVETLTALVDARLREGLRQIITTNHPYESLEAAWGGRLMDRLAYRWTVVTLTGPSRRKGWKV